VVQISGFRTGDGVTEAEAELPLGERDGVVAVGLLPQHRKGGADLGQRNLGDALDGTGVDRHGMGRQTSAEELLGDEPSERVPDHDGRSGRLATTSA
jgi:hypothetical protein